MRKLAAPPLIIDIRPKMRANGTIPGWSRRRESVRLFVGWLLANQNEQCAFCGFEVGDLSVRRTPSVDHIAPKGDGQYPEWTYEPLNLVITCHSCNSIFKNSSDTVAVNSVDYRLIAFNIVHPYLDEIEAHISGSYEGGSRRVELPKVHSAEGAKTIELFKLDNVNYLSAISSQADSIRLREWRVTASVEDVQLFDAMMAEVRGSLNR